MPVHSISRPGFTKLWGAHIKSQPLRQHRESGPPHQKTKRCLEIHQQVVSQFEISGVGGYVSSPSPHSSSLAGTIIVLEDQVLMKSDASLLSPVVEKTAKHTHTIYKNVSPEFTTYMRTLERYPGIPRSCCGLLQGFI